MKTKTSKWLLELAAVSLLAVRFPASAADAYPPAMSKPASNDFVHGVVNLEFSDHHLTARGINLQDKGLIFQPLVRLDWNLYKPDSLTNRTVDEVSLTTAIWNDFDTETSGVHPGHWNEIDLIAGPNVKFFNDWAFESPFIAYKSETGSFPACLVWNPRLTYHDHSGKNFSINPYAEFFWELQNKITVVLAPQKSERSFYGVAGADPTYVFDLLPLKLELPAYIIIPGNNFYQRKDGSGGGTDIALFTMMLKATVPLDFMGSSHGKWSIYASAQYDYLNNPGLLDGNEIAGAAHSRERNLVVFRGGVNVRF
jgi:hypothetical protein